MANIMDMVAGAQQPQQGQGAQPQPQAAPPGAPGAQPGGGGLAGLMPTQPAPSHHETVAAMRHFSIIANRLDKILRSDKCGKANCKGEIWDAAADFVGRGVLSITQVLNEMKSVSDDPAEQKRWLQQHVDNAKKAQMAVIEHHVAANPGSGDPMADFQAAQASKPEGDHASIMQGMMQQHYSRAMPKK